MGLKGGAAPMLLCFITEADFMVKVKSVLPIQMGYRRPRGRAYLRY